MAPSKEQLDVGLAGEAWDSLKYALEGHLLSGVNAGLQLGDFLPCRTVVRMSKWPFSQYDASRDCV